MNSLFWNWRSTIVPNYTNVFIHLIYWKIAPTEKYTLNGNFAFNFKKCQPTWDIIGIWLPHFVSSKQYQTRIFTTSTVPNHLSMNLVFSELHFCVNTFYKKKSLIPWYKWQIPSQCPLFSEVYRFEFFMKAQRLFLHSCLFLMNCPQLLKCTLYENY